MPSMPTAWANRFARRSSALVVILALIGLVGSIVILFLPAAGADLPDRANVSSAVAAWFALSAAIVAISAAIWVTTSDYKAEQAVKADTAKIRAALRSIMVKGVILSQKGPEQGTCIDFTTERETLNKFLSSTTAYGYWFWVETRGGAVAAGTGEPWRVFFLYLGSLLDSCRQPDDVGEMVQHAVRLEELFDKLDRSDIDTITRHVADLAGALGTAKTSKDVLLSSIHIVYGTDQPAEDLAQRKLRYLKETGVADPNLDLILAVQGDDVPAARAALEAGADMNVSVGEILAAHEAELANFDPTESG